MRIYGRLRYFESFSDSLSEGDEVIFYFAGHAIEDRDTNYLLSIDYRKSFNLDISLTVDRIQNSLYKTNNSGIKLIILDACRNNPVAAISPLPEKIKVNNNTLIAFSTSSGNGAKDGAGSNSYYTSSLVDSIKEYNLSIYEIFSRTRDEVIRHTKFSQVPWEHSSLLETSKFTFDNLNIPIYLERIIKSSSNLLYTVKCIGENFLAAGDTNIIDIFSVNSTASKGSKLDNQRENCNIEEIDENDDYLIFIYHDGKVLCVDKNSDQLLSRNSNISLYSGAINNQNIIFFGGLSDKLLGYDLDNSIALEIDIKNEVLCAIFDDDRFIEYVCRDLTVMSVAFSKTSPNMIAFGGSGSIFCIKDLDENKYVYMNENDKLFRYTYCIRFSNDGKYLATTHENGKTILWNAETIQLIHIFNANKNISKTHFFEFVNEKYSNNINCVEFSPDSKSIVIGTSESEVIFYDIKYMKKIKTIDLNIEPYPVNGLAFNRAGDKIFVSLQDKVYLFTT